MSDFLTWDDADAIAEILRHRFPDSDPSTVADLEIASWTREIPLLQGDPAAGPGLDAQVAAIRSAWQRGRDSSGSGPRA